MLRFRRSVVSYNGNSDSTAGWEKENEVIKDTELPSTEDIQPPLVHEHTKDKEPIEEPSFVANKAKPNLPYPSRLNKQKIREKDDILSFKVYGKSSVIFTLSYVSRMLLHMPKFARDYSPGIQKDLKVVEPKKSSVEYATSYEPKVEIPEVELQRGVTFSASRDAFLEENNKLPVIISKDLSQDEKTSLINIDYEPQCNISRGVTLKSTTSSSKIVGKLLEQELIYQFQISQGMLKRCEDTKLALNWEKSHFMVKEGIVLGHKISRKGIEVVRPCKVFNAIGAVLGQRIEKHFRPIHYASKTMTEAESNYTTTEKEMLAVVYAFEKFRSYLIMKECFLYGPPRFEILFNKKDAKASCFDGSYFIQEFDFLRYIDTKGAETITVCHLSRLENPYENTFDPKEITETFPLETLSVLTSKDQSYPLVRQFCYTTTR
ncbi:reverse transcriptase domain-containing protein [Tanacetum coccineum]